MSKKIKVAVTGGMGSGKSTVCEFFKQKGYPVIIADDIAKDILVDDENVKQKIINEFGENTYSLGKLNRQFLAEKVFPKKENVDKINSIVHPPTIKKINELAQQALQKSDLVFVESALIYEAKMWNAYDYVILVASEDEDKIKRVVARDYADKESVKKRLNNQIPEKQKRGKVDFVIENNSSLDDLKNRAAFILSILKNLAK